MNEITIKLLEKHDEEQSYLKTGDGIIIDVRTIKLLLDFYKSLKDEEIKINFESMLNTCLFQLVDFCWSVTQK